MVKDRKVELLSDDHLTVKGSRHSRFGYKWLLRAETRSTPGPAAKPSSKPLGTDHQGRRQLHQARRVGRDHRGPKVRINSGGSPGSGTGARPLLPELALTVERGLDVESVIFRGPSMAKNLDAVHGAAAGICPVLQRFWER